jgi:integrase
MPKYRENYTLYQRKQGNGKHYWYYRTYAPSGKLLWGKTTGKTSKQAARLYCEDLLKKGQLYGGSCKFFRDYAAGFFDDDSPWLSDRMEGSTPERPALSKSYIECIRLHLRRYILPFFDSSKMEELKPSLTRKFRTVLRTSGVAPVGELAKPLAAKTINNVVSTFRIICDAAIADGDLILDPLKTIKPLPEDEKKRDAFTFDEVRKVLKGIKDKSAYASVLTAACTGMRIAEVLGIRKSKIFPEYLNLTDQFYHGEVRPLKTKDARKIPLCPDFQKFVAAADYSARYEVVRYDFNRAVDATLTAAVHRKRGLCIHSLRHFFNTYLLAENVPPVKVAAVLGHSTGAGSMQERYTNWRPEQFPEVYTVQEKLFRELTK